MAIALGLQDAGRGVLQFISVAGLPVYRHGEATGALPGRLVRGQTDRPA